MTKYREIIRLTGLGFSQRNIMASCGVAQKTVVKVQKRARELKLFWPLDESMTDVELQRLMFSKESTVSQNKRMPTMITSARSCSVTESAKSSCGRNTWRIAVLTARNLSCIHSSVITSNRMSRNDVLPCISTANLANRSRSTGQVILQQSSIQILVKS